MQQGNDRLTQISRVKEKKIFPILIPPSQSRIFLQIGHTAALRMIQWFELPQKLFFLVLFFFGGGGKLDKSKFPFLFLDDRQAKKGKNCFPALSPYANAD